MILLRIAQGVLLLAAAAPALAAPACGYRGGQTWETLEENHPLGRASQLYLSGSLRTNCGFGGLHPYNGRGGVGFRWRPAKHLEVFPYYAFLAIAPGPNEIHEIALQIGAVDLPLGILAVQERNTIEEDFRSSGSTTRYTNELEISHPVRWEQVRFEPFAEEAVKYDLHRHGWDYTRLEAGASKEISKKFSLRIYYARQNGSRFSHGIINALGIQMNMRL